MKEILDKTREISVDEFVNKVKKGVAASIEK
jgi:hypothetical protein